MKITILAISFLALTSVHAKCTQNEAQFIGNITELKITNLGQNKRDCTFKISFTRFNESVVCPLSYTEAQSAELEDYLCSKKLTNGDEISGILIERNGYIYLE